MTKAKEENNDLLPAVEQVAKEVADHREQAHYVIRVQKVDQNSRNSIDPVPVGVNGVMYAIRRGKDALVPACVVEALEHATEIAYESDDNDASRKVPREVQSYPFQIIKGPIPADTVRKMRAEAKRAA